MNRSWFEGDWIGERRLQTGMRMTNKPAAEISRLWIERAVAVNSMETQMHIWHRIPSVACSIVMLLTILFRDTAASTRSSSHGPPRQTKGVLEEEHIHVGLQIPSMASSIVMLHAILFSDTSASTRSCWPWTASSKGGAQPRAKPHDGEGQAWEERGEEAVSTTINIPTKIETLDISYTHNS